MAITNTGYLQGPGTVGHGPPMAVTLRGIHKHFGPVQAVRGIDLDIAAGEIVAFFGPNGAGKTTTIDMILGLSQPTAGDVIFAGGAIWRFRKDTARV
jgi:ABC-2 type transport system ATP-binding protein